MEPKPRADLESVIDSSRINALQITIIVFCALIAALDGFDTQAIAFVAPEIIREWHMAQHAFGFVFASGLAGGLVGAVAMGFASDRYGRKGTLVLAIMLMSLGSLGTVSAHTTNGLIVMRFLTGLGLGGALPSFIALVSEYAPRRARSTLVGLMFCGFPLGAVVGGLVAAWLIPGFGWKSVFIVGGALPLAILPFFVLLVPESARFAAMRGRPEAVSKVLARLDNDAEWNGQIPESGFDGRPRVASLFMQGRAAGTLLLWLAFFLSLLLTYFLINWIPVVVRNSGIDLKSAVVAVAMLDLGAVAGSVVIGRLADRIGQTSVIGLAYLSGSLAIYLIGRIDHSATSLYVVTFAAGALSIGAQMCTVALCAEFYETHLRATGIGWCMGVGRVGAIAGPVIGGGLIGLGYDGQSLFLFAGMTSLMAAMAVFALRWVVRTTPRVSPAVSAGGGCRNLRV